ncbi:MAG: tyrosine-protein phosphatase [Ruminiclostridium sp.]|nr:tyrosine-protein phosphatase [Ruminiclostridium sp.]
MAVSVSGCGSNAAAPEKTVEVSVPGNIVTKESQQLTTTSIINARDLGGYHTVDGKTIKRGLLLRTAKLSTATEEDIAILKNDYNLGYVIDMRVGGEAGTDTDPVIEGVEQVNLPVGITAFITKSYAATDPEERLAILKKIYEDGEIGEYFYANALKQDSVREQYKLFFDVLLKSKGEKAVLWHCSHGKDRTGIGAALLLYVFGVDEETILKDFLLTNEFYAGAEDAAREQFMTLFPDEPDLANAMAALSGGVKEQYLRHAIDYMKEESGSVEAFVREKIGVSDEDIGLLRSYYLI